MINCGKGCYLMLVIQVCMQLSKGVSYIIAVGDEVTGSLVKHLIEMEPDMLYMVGKIFLYIV